MILTVYLCSINLIYYEVLFQLVAPYMMRNHGNGKFIYFYVSKNEFSRTWLRLWLSNQCGSLGLCVFSGLANVEEGLSFLAYLASVEEVCCCIMAVSSCWNNTVFSNMVSCIYTGVVWSFYTRCTSEALNASGRQTLTLLRMGIHNYIVSKFISHSIGPQAHTRE